MSEQHLQREPHLIRGVENVWWYEETKGMEVIIEQAGMPAQHVTIPWSAVRYALARKDRP